MAQYEVVSGQSGKAITKPVSKALAAEIAKSMRKSTGGSFKVVKIQANPSKRSVRRRVAKALKKYVRGNAGRRSIRKHKKRLVRKEREGALSMADAKTLGLLRGLKGRRLQSNPPRVKGRKTKGGRAVTLKNFTGTIVKKSDGTVQIVGRGRRK